MATEKKELKGEAKRIFERVKAGKLTRSDLASVLGKLARENGATEAQKKAAAKNGAKGGRPRGKKPTAKKTSK